MEMILYRMAKWMEERKRITQTMRGADGDLAFLKRKLQQNDEDMLAEARSWRWPDSSISHFLIADRTLLGDSHPLANHMTPSAMDIALIETATRNNIEEVDINLEMEMG